MVFWVRNGSGDSHWLWPGPIPLLYSSTRSFQRSLKQPKRRSYANVFPLGSWHTNLSLRGPQKCWCFIFQGHVQGLFPLIIYVKSVFQPLCNTLLQMRSADTSLLRDKLPPFKRVLLFFIFYSFCNFTSVIESEFIASLCFFHISMFYFTLT